jgi:diguanylate cyclase (GGDEF)-like protein
VAQNESDHGGDKLLEHVLAGLEGLKESPVGRVMHEQVAHLIQEHAGVQARLLQAYGQLVHLLLDTYAREPSAEHVTRVNARLFELRETVDSGSNGAAALPPPVDPGAARLPHGDPAPATTDRTRAETTNGTSLARGSRLDPTGDVPPAASAIGQAEPRQPDGGAASAVSPPAERRINSAYRLHLDRKRDEIEKLQEALATNVSETITQNREFGALLHIELRALQQAEGAQEIEQLRQILIGGIEELIHGQRLLDGKLHRTADYLDLIKSDSARLRDELHKVRLLSLTDEFTGLPNRRAFMRRLHDEIGRAQRYGTELALALIDLDGFKAVNDQYGHAAGDEILRCYARDVLSTLRHHDLAARYGGEEFAVLLPNTGKDGALAALHKMRARAREMRCEYEGRGLGVPTFSAGLTLYVPDEAHTSFVDRADRALYRAKELGRDRVELVLAGAPAEAADKPAG